MRFLKRFCCIALSIIILSLSIGTKYFDSNHMENVEATAEVAAVGLSAAAMYAICFYVGTLAYANAPIEMNNLSDDQIVSMGYSTISYMVGHNLLNSTSAPNLPMIGFMDKAGQSVAFSNEAAKTIAATSLLLIMMGANSPDNNDDDNNDDDGNDKNNDISVSDGLIKMAKNPKDLFACCSTGFAALLGSIIREQYAKYQNGEESIYLDVGNQYAFTDYESIKNSSGNYSYYGVSTFRETASQIDPPLTYAVYSRECNLRLVCIDGGIYKVDQSLDPTDINFKLYQNGAMTYSGHRSEVWYWFNDDVSNLSLSLNMPMYNTRAEAEAAILANDFSDAMNYAKSYRIADWEQEDWAGILKDPLTGLTALGNLANIARHQGLNALGNEIDTDAFNDYLRDYFANTDPDEFPLPSPDPLKVPILWPTGALDPETSIDPSRNPAILPDPNIKPDPGPGTDPDPGVNPNPDPGVNPNPDPGTDPTPDVIDIPVEDVVPTVNDSLFDVAGSIRYKFPFSIPWDLRYLFTVLADTPKAPYFELPIVIERYGINEKIIVDLKPYEKLSVLSRSLFSLLFAIGLIKLTFLVVGMRKEE